jgi:hypothetical protein
MIEALGKQSKLTQMKVPERIQLTGLGEWYKDLLAIDSWINGDTPTSQARSLLRAKLMQRETTIKERVAYLANKRGVAPDLLWLQILKGEAEAIKSDEIDLDKIAAAAEKNDKS